MMQERERLFDEIPKDRTFFLLTGPGRSGTSLATHILRMHSGIDIISEPYIARLEPQLDDDQRAELMLLLKYTSTEVSKKPAIGIAEKAGAFIHSDFDSIMRYFASKIVLVVRDPRDCLVSAREKWFQTNKSSSFIDEDDYLGAYTKLVDWVFSQEEKGVPTQFVRYEDMVSPEGTALDDVVEFLGCVSEHDSMMSLATQTEFNSRGDRKLKVSGGAPHVSSIGRWRESLDGSDLKKIQSQFGSRMTTLGYE